jgi:hypothetical protein
MWMEWRGGEPLKLLTLTTTLRSARPGENIASVSPTKNPSWVEGCRTLTYKKWSVSLASGRCEAADRP